DEVERLALCLHAATVATNERVQPADREAAGIDDLDREVSQSAATGMKALERVSVEGIVPDRGVGHAAAAPEQQVRGCALHQLETRRLEAHEQGAEALQCRATRRARGESRLAHARASGGDAEMVATCRAHRLVEALEAR